MNSFLTLWNDFWVPPPPLAAGGFVGCHPVRSGPGPVPVRSGPGGPGGPGPVPAVPAVRRSRPPPEAGAGNPAGGRRGPRFFFPSGTSIRRSSGIKDVMVEHRDSRRTHHGADDR